MEDLSLHILDVAENSVTSGAKNVRITIDEDTSRNLMTIEIEDDGSGMDEETLNKVRNHSFTSKKTRRFGLGLALLSQSANEAGGDLKIESKKGEGTRIVATFQLDHIDLKPLGNMNETMEALIIGNPKVDFKLITRR